MVAGADCIDDMDLLRHGGMGRLFDQVRAPSTLGTFLRCFTFGHVRQLDAVTAGLLARLAAATPVLTGAEQVAFVDLDDTVRPTYGYAKQGADRGHTGVNGLNADSGHHRGVTRAAAAPGLVGRGGDAHRDPRLLAVLDAVCDSVDRLTAALTEAFARHPDYHIITSFPGLADVAGAVVLAELGDDRTRFADDRALLAFARSAPVTRASGKSRTVTRRRTKNNRLAAIGYCWAFTAVSRPSPTRKHYLRRRDRGDRHQAALRHLSNRMLGQLHHCLATGQTYDPAKAFPHATTTPAEPVVA